MARNIKLRIWRGDSTDGGLKDVVVEANEGEVEKGHEGDNQKAAAVAPAPLQRVPTSTSVTLIGPAGVVLGQIGGDLNSIEISHLFAKNIFH